VVHLRPGWVQKTMVPEQLAVLEAELDGLALYGLRVEVHR